MGSRIRIVAALLAVLTVAFGVTDTLAASVEGLYEGTVQGDATEDGRVAAATEALRQVAVRVTGRRSAASDPALAALYADARRLARTFRSVTAGQIVVAFDPAAVDAGLARAGQRLWSRERPLTLVVLANGRPGAVHSLAAVDPENRRAVTAAAQLRGLPIVWPPALAAVIDQARYDDAVAGRLEPLKALARDLGADGVLVGRIGPGVINWTWSGPAGEGSAAGAAGEGVQALADRYGAELATAATEAGRLVATVRGVRDLAGYAQAGSALAGAPNVRSVVLEEANGDVLRFRIAFDGDPEAVRRALRDSARLAPDDTAPSAGTMQFVLRP